MRAHVTVAGPQSQQSLGRLLAPLPARRRQTAASTQSVACAGQRRGLAGSLPRRRQRASGATFAAAAAGRRATSAAVRSQAGSSNFATDSRGTVTNNQNSGKDGDAYFVTDKRGIILYDGVCNLCNGGVNFMLDWDREGRYRFCSLQSPAGRALLQRSGRSPDDISSIVLVEAGASYIKSAAILRIAAGLQLPLPLVAAALDTFPRFFKDGVYDQIADNRYKIFGRSQSCRLSDARFAERFVS